MEKQKRWQFYLIVAVTVLTLFNILPTIFFYTKPLKDPIDQPRAENVALGIVERVNALEGDAVEWLYSFSNLLHLKPESVTLKKDDPGTIEVVFNNAEDASIFKRFLPRAGTLIPFVPSQLSLHPGEGLNNKSVLVSREINVHLDPNEIKNQFHYFAKYDGEKISKDYLTFIDERAVQIASGLTGPSVAGLQLQAIARNGEGNEDAIISIARDIKDFTETFGETSLTKRFYKTYFRINDASEAIQKYLVQAEKLKESLKKELDTLSKSDHRYSIVNSQYLALDKGAALIKKNSADFNAGVKALTENELRTALTKTNLTDLRQTLSLMNRNPFIESLVVDLGNDRIETRFYDDVQNIRLTVKNTEEATFLQKRLNNYIINDLAKVSRESDEYFTPKGDEYAVNLSKLTDARSFLNFNLGFLAKKLSAQIKEQIAGDWKPVHPDLTNKTYDYDEFQKLSALEKKLGIIIYAPSMSQKEPPAGFRKTSLYVIARGMDNLVQKIQANPEAPESKKLQEEMGDLASLLKQKGFIAYPGTSFEIAPEFSRDYIFELSDYYATLLNATREDFYVKGSKQFATLDFTDVEQRIIALNKIEDKIQEDLVKWRDEYNAARVDVDSTRRFEIPKPTENVFLANLKLSAAKYFRGDDRKIIRWGLDLSGGKTVRIGLVNQNNQPVTNPEDLQTAVNELYTRINNMGVSERTIRIENNNIILDFPGSQALSAAELIKSSAMYFHIVNEKFSLRNSDLQNTVNQFLQNVWNEAVVTNRKDSESVNEIAWQHFGGDDEGAPRGESARVLFNAGLRLANPQNKARGSTFDDTLSTIAVMRGDDFSEWYGQSHPLMIVFHNYALEGSSLTNIQVGHDPMQGNLLSFTVKKSYDRGVKGNPQDDFYAWTSEFAQDKITGTPKEDYTHGDGWRMAVILNDTIITNPSLKSALREGGTISGKFTQREINNLAADLKAGSLSFTPKILSEQNVSPELGKEERTRGLLASLLGLVLVAAAMIGYYRFAGVVATCAVLFNLLIMWGVFQNIGAALTLPGIAGIVLTIGMAVDANVLVYERIREEFKLSGRIAHAIHAGYRKAFSAIFDSNITTIIAAFLLIQFDSGPIKGFAVTLIIGLISSMFTALFMTRYYFAGWVQNPEHKELKMADIFGKVNFDFLAQTKKAITISAIVMVAGTYLFFSQMNTMFGMDFTGGYSLNLELQEKTKDFPYRLKTYEALVDHGVHSTDIQVRQLSKPNQLRIQLGLGMEEKGRPFYQMPERIEGANFTYAYEHDPRLTWVVNTLKEAGLEIPQSSLESLQKDWSMMGSQFSSQMRNNALFALGLALLSILAYITIRFEFKFAIGAVIGLAHDIIITMGIYAMFHWLGLPVQIDLTVIGAIMTILGYSLNNTIVIFDRIREDMKVMRKVSFADIVNHSINVTLSRTINTSTTVLLVLIPLLLLGGHSIFAFTLVMTLGVVIGVFSSLFVAGPVMLFLHERETQLRHTNEA